MNRKLYIGFKGKNNASCILAQSISENHYLLTNSFGGLKKDIELLDFSYDYIIMFGIDKNLKNSVRIEQAAEKDTIEYSVLDLEKISECLNANGVKNYICDKPIHYLCNEAYWFVLRKFNGKAVFIHIPSIKNIDEIFIDKIKIALG
ncbi:MAG: hypothetical protein ACI4SF_05700 [Oscillospiraceae bacterium]